MKKRDRMLLERFSSPWGKPGLCSCVHSAYIGVAGEYAAGAGAFAFAVVAFAVAGVGKYHAKRDDDDLERLWDTFGLRWSSLYGP